MSRLSELRALKIKQFKCQGKSETHSLLRLSD